MVISLLEKRVAKVTIREGRATVLMEVALTKPQGFKRSYFGNDNSRQYHHQHTDQ